MRVMPIVQRLTDQCPALRQVLPAVEAAVPASYPSAYVFTIREAAGQNMLMAGAHAQLLRITVGIEIMIRSARDHAHGSDAADLLEDVRDQIAAALAGWQPDADHEPLAFAEGQLVAFEPGIVTWRDTWTTARQLRTI